MIRKRNRRVVLIFCILFTIISGCEKMTKSPEDFLEGCTPEPMKISDMGWQSFLENWNKQYMELYTSLFHQFGWEPQYYKWMTNERLRDDFQKYKYDSSLMYIFNPQTLGENISEWKGVRDYLHSGANDADYYVKSQALGIENDYIVRVNTLGYQGAIKTIAVNQKLYLSPFTGNVQAAAQLGLDTYPDLSLYYAKTIPEDESISATVKKFMDGAALPDSYLEFIKTSNGFIATSLFLGIRKEPDPYDFGLFAIEQIGYLINTYTGLGLWDYLEEEFDTDFKGISIPTSIVFGGGEPDTLLVFDFSKPTGNGEYKIFAVAGNLPEILASWDSFPEFMEDNYPKSIASICMDLKELEQAREDGSWKPIKER